MADDLSKHTDLTIASRKFWAFERHKSHLEVGSEYNQAENFADLWLPRLDWARRTSWLDFTRTMKRGF